MSETDSLTVSSEQLNRRLLHFCFPIVYKIPLNHGWFTLDPKYVGCLILTITVIITKTISLSMALQFTLTTLLLRITISIHRI